MNSMRKHKEIYGVIGYPVAHSYSAIMHNVAFKELGITAEYRLFSVEPKNLDNFMKRIGYLEISGFNVTIPHKEAIIPFLNGLSDAARAIGAVNTIVIERNKMSGFNTDGPGFIEHITKDLNFTIKGKTVSIVGAGGAARALTYYLAKNEAGAVYLYDLDRDKCVSLAADMARKYPGCDILPFSDLREMPVEKSHLFMNATPVGLNKDDPEVIDVGRLNPRSLVYDLLYNPQETRLLYSARKRGIRASNGLGMLLYQGVLAFEFWKKVKPPVESMRNALKEAIAKNK